MQKTKTYQINFKFYYHLQKKWYTDFTSGGFWPHKDSIEIYRVHSLIHFNVVYSREAEIEFEIQKPKIKISIKNMIDGW